MKYPYPIQYIYFGIENIQFCKRVIVCLQIQKCLQHFFTVYSPTKIVRIKAFISAYTLNTQNALRALHLDYSSYMNKYLLVRKNCEEASHFTICYILLETN